MHSGHKAMTGFVTIILALLLLIAGLVTRWPLWAWALSACALGAGAVLSLVWERRRRPVFPPDRLQEPDLPIAPVERWECTVRDVALPSLLEDYDFLFSATIRWVPHTSSSEALVVNAGGLAVDAVLQRARHITEGSDPHRCSLIQHRLNGELATMRPDAGGQVTAMAENVRLRLEEADRERLEKLATVRKNEAVWEHERKWEQSRRAYLGDDVLSTPGSAVVWWLAKNDEQIDKTVADIGLLAELASAAHDQPVPADFHRFIPGLTPQSADEQSEPRKAPRSPDDRVDLLLESIGLPEEDPRLLLFLERITEYAAGAGQTDIAEALQRRLGRLTAAPPVREEPRRPDSPGPDHRGRNNVPGPDSYAF
ncbi:hypothetical protein ACFW6K_34965 [Streptomyces sp. NPDC058733]|uniref:hypothetical protein n=1 Tax=unclassified Streptomyces TaxID=2593676 RepID=UPI0036822CC4